MDLESFENQMEMCRGSRVILKRCRRAQGAAGRADKRSMRMQTARDKPQNHKKKPLKRSSGHNISQTL